MQPISDATAMWANDFRSWSHAFHFLAFWPCAMPALSTCGWCHITSRASGTSPNIFVLNVEDGAVEAGDLCLGDPGLAGHVSSWWSLAVRHGDTGRGIVVTTAAETAGRVARHAPSRIHRSPRARSSSVTARPPMKHTANATHNQTSPRSPTSHADGGEQAEGHQLCPGQVDGVAGADQHPVEHEDDAGDRLGERRDEQHRHEQVRTTGSPVNSRPEDGADGGQREAGDDAGEPAPALHPPRSRRGCPARRRRRGSGR